LALLRKLKKTLLPQDMMQIISERNLVSARFPEADITGCGWPKQR